MNISPFHADQLTLLLQRWPNLAPVRKKRRRCSDHVLFDLSGFESIRTPGSESQISQRVLSNLMMTSEKERSEEHKPSSVPSTSIFWPVRHDGVRIRGTQPRSRFEDVFTYKKCSLFCQTQSGSSPQMYPFIHAVRVWDVMKLKNHTGQPVSVDRSSLPSSILTFVHWT